MFTPNCSLSHMQRAGTVVDFPPPPSLPYSWISIFSLKDFVDIFSMLSFQNLLLFQLLKPDIILSVVTPCFKKNPIIIFYIGEKYGRDIIAMDECEQEQVESAAHLFGIRSKLTWETYPMLHTFIWKQHFWTYFWVHMLRTALLGTQHHKNIKAPWQNISVTS